MPGSFAAVKASTTSIGNPSLELRSPILIPHYSHASAGVLRRYWSASPSVNRPSGSSASSCSTLVQAALNALQSQSPHRRSKKARDHIPIHLPTVCNDIRMYMSLSAMYVLRISWRSLQPVNGIPNSHTFSNQHSIVIPHQSAIRSSLYKCIRSVGV